MLATTAPTSKIEQRLPRYPVVDGAGIEELYAAYTGANLSAADWDGDRYYRLRTINLASFPRPDRR